MATASAAQDQGRAQVMILGVYHFAANSDYVAADPDDHLSPKRQAEIAEAITLLAAFKPTKIAIEVEPPAAELQTSYQAFLKGEYTLRVNESEQLGFRLAKQFGHARLYPIDNIVDFNMGAVLTAAQQSNNRVFMDFFEKAIGEVQDLSKRQAAMTVRENLLALNAPHMMSLGHDIYRQIARVRSGDDLVGADVLATWYQRNFRIYANLASIIERSDDRVLVIFGSGHAPILREMVASSPDMLLVEPGGYLTSR
jgi:hypothetical protein